MAGRATIKIERLQGRGAELPTYMVQILHPLLITGRSLNWAAPLSFEDLQALSLALEDILKRRSDDVTIEAALPGTAKVRNVREGKK